METHLETPMPSHLANEIVFSIGEKKKKSEKENMRVERVESRGSGSTFERLKF